IQAYFRNLSPLARQRRFLGALNELSPAELDRIARADCRSGCTLIAEHLADADHRIVGEARYALAPDRLGFEVAVSVAEAWRRRSLATQLLAHLERKADSLGARYLFGDVLRANEPMRALAQKLGFSETAPIGDARLVRITKDLPSLHSSLADAGL